MFSPSAERKKPSSLREILTAFLKHNDQSRWMIPLQLFVLFLDGLIQATLPGLLGYVVDCLIRDPAKFVQTQMIPLSWGLLLYSALFYLVAFVQHYLSRAIGLNVGIRFQVRLYAHLQRLSADFYQRTQVGEITSRLTNDINHGVMPLYGQFNLVFWAFCVVIPSCITLAVMSWQLFLVFLGVSFFFMLLTKIVVPRIRELNRDQQDEAGRINARITESVSANTLIRAFAREQFFTTALQEHSTAFLDKAMKASKFSLLFADFMQAFVKILAPFTLLVVGAYFVAQGSVTVGSLVAAHGYWLTAIHPISAILSQITVIFSSFASVDRILEFFRETPMVKDAEHAEELRMDQGEIVLQNITFRYPVSDGDIVLQDLNLTIPAKQNLAIVGESGAGKSTIIQLILRFYDPQAGEVLIDGKNIRTVTQASLRRQIGLVMQETILLSGTVRENMRMAKLEATDEEIIRALEYAGMWEPLRHSQGLDTLLGERGTRLSGGQRQRISIARVFLKDPRIVIFDEATSALDSITEDQIHDSMRQLFTGRTAIIIAHRLSTIADCDRIALIERGIVGAIGTHEELMASSPRYCEMFRRQSPGTGILV